MTSKTYPNNDSARPVGRTNLEVGALGDVVEEELKEILGLFGLVPDDTFRETLIHVERLLASRGVHAHKGVL